MRELSFLNKGVKISIEDKKKDQMVITKRNFKSKEGLKEFVSYLDKTRESIIKDVISIQGEKNGIPVEIAMVYNSSFLEFTFFRQ